MERRPAGVPEGSGMSCPVRVVLYESLYSLLYFVKLLQVCA